MSADSQKRRSWRRAAAAALSDPTADAPPVVEPTARAVLLWVVPGEGWYWASAELPESVVREHAEAVRGPEILPIAMAKCFELLEQHAGKGVI